MSENTWRVFATLLDIQRDTDRSEITVSVNDVASRGAVSNGVAERELERLWAVGAVEEVDGGEYRYAGQSVEEAAQRLATLDELDDDERDALSNASKQGDVDPGVVLGNVHDAREAAERAMGSETE